MALSGRLGYNGVFHEAGAGCQLLGNGHRTYNPVVMRFHSSDRLSPFGRGGLNAYAYCTGNPVDFKDPGGQFAVGVLGLLGAVGVLTPLVPSALSRPESAGDNSEGLNPWLMGLLVAAVAVLGTGGVAVARRLSPRRRGLAPAGRHSSQDRSRRSRPDSSARAYKVTSAQITNTPQGAKFVDVRELEKPIVSTIKAIRSFAPGGKTPNALRAPPSKHFGNYERRLPREHRTYYREYRVSRVYQPRYAATRLVTGGGDVEGIKNIWLTDDHYASFLEVADWQRYQGSGSSWR